MGGLRRERGRGGRPPLERAGQVEERILDAAQEVFVRRGFDGASVDEIAQTARAGKPTIYARYANKDGLFRAVMARQVARNTQFETLVPRGRTFHAKLVNLGIALIERALEADTIGLLRSGIAEAERFPELTRGINEMARKRAAANLAKVFAELAREEGIAGSGAFAPAKIIETARIFLDLVLFAMFFSRLLGEDVKTLKKQLPAYVRQRVDFFLAACRDGCAAEPHHRPAPE